MTPRRAPLVIRADAGEKIGSGHLMRCLALAQAWQDSGGEVRHMGTALPPSLAARLAGERIASTVIDEIAGSPADATQTAALVREFGAEWLVLDGYQFGVDYQRAVGAADVPTLLIDDFAQIGDYAADAILDQNLDTPESAYARRRDSSRLLLGPRFALLRREFARWRDWSREVSPVGRRVLVTLGGSDPHNETLKVIAALQEVKVDGLETVIVAGGGNPHHASLAAAVRAAGSHIRLLIDVANLDEHMAWADLAIGAAGSTSWERALLGLPSLVLVLAENQRAIARALDAAGCALDLGWAREISTGKLTASISAALHDEAWRARASERSRRLVDGCGAGRVVEVLTQMERAVRCA